MPFVVVVYFFLFLIIIKNHQPNLHRNCKIIFQKMGEIYGKENQEICFQNKRDPKIKKDYWSFVNQNLLFKEIE